MNSLAWPLNSEDGNRNRGRSQLPDLYETLASRFCDALRLAALDIQAMGAQVRIPDSASEVLLRVIVPYPDEVERVVRDMRSSQ